MDNEECDHEQLYAVFKVEVKVPIAHNSAKCISGALDDLNADLGELRQHGWKYEISKSIQIEELDGPRR